MAKIFTFKGKTVEELQKMPLEEFAKLIPSRRRRSLRRGLSPQQKKLLERVRKKQKAIKTHVRDAVILPEWLGLTFGVYNGKAYKNVVITVTNLGKRLGDFSHSTGRVLHSGPGVGATRGSKFVPLK